MPDETPDRTETTNDETLTPTTKFEMLGQSGAVCVDGVCAIPDVDDAAS
ncbi:MULTISPECIES: hypothetical protein [unclassified Gordonia (in: high G+C Gram-positive bacteria)]